VRSLTQQEYSFDVSALTALTVLTILFSLFELPLAKEVIFEEIKPENED
jgi:hypothetical protein